MKIQTTMRLATSVIVLTSVAACTPDQGGALRSQTIEMLPVSAAPGSMGPNLARGTDGTIVLSWIEPAGDGHSLRFSSMQDGKWDDPRTVVSGANWFVNWADFPSVAPLTDSMWAAHWLVSQEAGGYAYDVHAAVSIDAGETWSASVVPHSDNTDTEHGFVSLYPDKNNVGMIWLDGRKMVNDFDEHDRQASGMTLRAANLDARLALSAEALVDGLICDCCQTDVAITAEGPVAIYRNRTEEEVRDIYIARQVNGQWQPGVAVASDNWQIDACPVNGPVVQANGTTVAAAWFTAPNESPSVKVAWSDDAGRTFSEPLVIAADRPRGHVGAALLDNGSLALSWLGSTDSGGAELILTLIERSGAPGSRHVMSQASDVFAFSVPQLSHDGDTLVVAWTTEIEGIYGVASARVPVEILQRGAD